MVCYSESFLTLSLGYELAVWALGYVAPEHRTDNLTAATKRHGNSREFTLRWTSCLEHYGVMPSRNNPGESQENGSVEKSNDLFKVAVEQQMLMRGSRDFQSIAAYEAFIKQIEAERNSARHELLVEEIKLLKPLPKKRWYSPEQLLVRVSSDSTITIDKIPYSVPSRLVGYKLKALVFLTEIILYYGNKQVYKMERAQRGELHAINYRHIIDELIKKPGAFENYKYKEALFPRLCFRQAFDVLKKDHPTNGHKHYLKLLQLAKLYSEQQVSMAIELLLESQSCPYPEEVTRLIKVETTIRHDVCITAPDLSIYDRLRQIPEQYDTDEENTNDIN